MLEIGKEVKAYNSRCIGAVIDSWTYTGTIKKINKKSVVVELTGMVHKFGSREVQETSYSGNVRYTYWKTTNDGRAIYRSQLNGIIEVTI